MKNDYKNPLWITVPEKEQAKSTLGLKQGLSSHPDKVNHKVFWGMGLVALLVFSTLIFMPGTFSSLVKGDLFDGQFQVVPDTTNSADNPFFGGTGSSSNNSPSLGDASSGLPTSTASAPSDSNLNSTPASDAESIEINPLNTPSNPSSQEQVPAQTLDSSTAVSPSSQDTQALLELQSMIENLSAQLEALKQEGGQKDSQIQALMAQLEQEQQMHAAAKPESTTPSAQTNASSSQAQDTEAPYRSNPYTVKADPREVLSQKQQASSASVPAPAANSENTSSSMNAALSEVNTQPTTGPMETLMIAFLMSSFGILGYGIYKRVRA